jgi:hypothetical protein
MVFMSFFLRCAALFDVDGVRDREDFRRISARFPFSLSSELNWHVESPFRVPGDLSHPGEHEVPKVDLGDGIP